ncbi:MAG: PQQ-binding-like beta-propeller repeat protein [Opitutales bacterium]|nr:PQQ-binding-like beta-propeller repeat protein [Opitutales bacterium]
MHNIFMKLQYGIYSTMTLRHTLILLCFALSPLSAEWNNWRGPNFNLTSGNQDFPNEFSDSQNVFWSADLPGEGASTPAIWKNSLYITSMDRGTNMLFAYNQSGKKKWEAQVGKGEGGSHRQGTGANPSPVVDSSGVYVYFKSAILAKFNHAGKELWRKDLQKEYSITSQWWDLGTSPVVADGKVFVAVMQQLSRRSGEKAETYVLALDKDSGKEIWKIDRNTGANTESMDAYTTPLIATVDGQQQLIVWGADQLSGHSIKTGKAIWTCGDFNPTNHKNWRTIASHTIVGDTAIVPYGRGYAVTAIKMGGMGDITSTSRKWEIQRIGPDVPTPTVYGESTIVLNDRGIINAIDIDSGNIIWESALPRTKDKYFASPIIAGDRLICCRDDGTVFICGLNKDGMEILSENHMGEPVIATPVPYNDKLFIRTASTLYCIGEKS